MNQPPPNQPGWRGPPGAPAPPRRPLWQVVLAVTLSVVFGIAGALALIALAVWGLLWLTCGRH